MFTRKTVKIKMDLVSESIVGTREGPGSGTIGFGIEVLIVCTSRVSRGLTVVRSPTLLKHSTL
jgi:hypothetical protein